MKFLPAVSIIAMSVSSAFAQNFEPAPYELTDGFSIIPQVTAGVRYDDNIYNDEFNSTSSSIYILKPSIKFGTDDGINRYGGLYELTSATYSKGSEDNFLDHNIALLAHTEFSAKHRTDFKFGFANLHEDRGDGLTETNPNFFAEPLKYNALTARGYYQYGGLTSLMRIGGGVAYGNKTYQNFVEQTKYSDSNGLRFFADADYQVGDVTFLTFDLFSTDIQYDHLRVNSDSRDNVDSRALIGLKWKGLGKTTGTMKAGYQYKTFDNDNRESFSGNTANIGLAWKPVEYSTFNIHLNRDAEDSDTVGDYIEVLGASIGWDHNWTEKLNSSVQFIYSNEDYIGASRSDDTSNALFYVDYSFTRWLKVTAGYEFTTKDSTAANISYDKNAANIGVVVAL
ncbi:outer membrane beta-barrel protein [Psychromonas sp. Urea-02u-13]|uniref:outer membrane beta-barrel protein n=1 Tax=Psychromonas sp. Urea-02u-13 TaxID=2058326 RepID=UPI0012FEC49B|nr:outer membrane beta-barrel protein [Psychromonas sp. Urea-02u-13]